MWIYLIRHGETDGNKNRILQSPDTPLSERGHQQATQLALSFVDKSASAILCSPHVRTQQTAAPLRERLQCPVLFSDLLQERSFGSLRGKAYAEIQDDFFAADYCPPDGETHEQFSQRVLQAWQQVSQYAEQLEGNLVVVTHGLVLRVILTDILAVSEQQLSSIRFENTCVTQIKKDDLSVIPLLCDVTHLQEDALGSAGSV